MASNKPVEVYVDRPFRFTGEGGAVREFGVGVHEVEPDLLDHWWFKAHNVRKVAEVKNPAVREMRVTPLSVLGAMAYPVVEQTPEAFPDAGDPSNAVVDMTAVPVANADLDAREQAIKDKEAALSARETDLRQREAELAKGTQIDTGITPAVNNAPQGGAAPAPLSKEAAAARPAPPKAK